jgi:hypothetical protein
MKLNSSSRLPRRGGASTSQSRAGRRRRRPVFDVLEGRLVLSTTWVQQGPGPIINGQDEGITSALGNNPVSGAIADVAPGSTADILYVATVNGGVWKTTNATAATPIWTPLTDSASLAAPGQTPSLSLDSIALSPLNSNTLFAGAGRMSSYGGDGGDLFGIARSTDGGSTWAVFGPTGLTVRDVIATQATVAGNEVILAGTTGGVYRSTDGGSTYSLITTGIPSGEITDLVGDPGVSTRFYAANNGSVYMSNDTGATWTLDNGVGFPGTTGTRVLLSVHNDANNDVVYGMVISTTNGTLSNVYRSANQGGNWTALGVPSPPIFPGGQGTLHGAIIADSTDPNSVWIAGDRQNSPFPNVNGANNFSANIFQFTAAGGWQNRVVNGANGTSPHADSRRFAYDASGRLVLVNDGGIFALNNPESSTRAWVSLNGTIIPTEAHSATFDPTSTIYFSGNQDTGTSIGIAVGGTTWNDVLQGDGGNVAVDNVTAAPNSVRYVGFTGLPTNRVTYNPSNVIQTAPAINYSITSGPGTGQTINQFDPNIQFFNPYALNRVNPARMFIGTASLYESMDQGNTVTDFGFTGNFIGDGFGNSPISYGGLNANGTSNPGSVYVGAGAQLLHRSADGSSIVTLGAYPGTTIRALVSDPENVAHIFVLDTNSNVWGSFDEGATWTNLSANLATLSDSVRSIQIFSPDNTPRNTVLLVGGAGGVFQMRRPGAAGTIWTSIGTGLPKGVLVYDITYDYTQNVLTIGTLGRGVWSLSSYFRGGGGTGFGGAFGGNGVVTPPPDGSGTTDFPLAPPIAFSGPGVVDGSGQTIGFDSSAGGGLAPVFIAPFDGSGAGLPSDVVVAGASANRPRNPATGDLVQISDLSN